MLLQWCCVIIGCSGYGVLLCGSLYLCACLCVSVCSCVCCVLGYSHSQQQYGGDFPHAIGREEIYSEIEMCVSVCVCVCVCVCLHMCVCTPSTG